MIHILCCAVSCLHIHANVSSTVFLSEKLLCTVVYRGAGLQLWWMLLQEVFIKIWWSVAVKVSYSTKLVQTPEWLVSSTASRMFLAAFCYKHLPSRQKLGFIGPGYILGFGASMLFFGLSVGELYISIIFFFFINQLNLSKRGLLRCHKKWRSGC